MQNNEQTSIEREREIVARLETLTRHLLRLEDRYDPVVASAAAADCQSLAILLGDRPPAVVAFVTALANAVVDVRDGRLALSADLAQALIAAVDNLAKCSERGGAAEEAIAEAATLDLKNEQVKAKKVSPPEIVDLEWPAPCGSVSPELLSQFTSESIDSLHEAETALLDLENQGEQVDAVNRLFRAVHSIKGTSGYVGLAQIQKLSHKLENVLALVRSSRLSLADGVSELVFHGVDHLKGMVGDLTQAGEVPRDLRSFVIALDSLCEGASSVSEQLEAVDSKPEVVYQKASSQHLEGLADGLNSVAKGDCSDSVLAMLRRSITSLKNSSTFVGREDIEGPADELLAVLGQLKSIREKFSNLVSGNEIPTLLPPAPQVEKVVKPAAKVAASTAPEAPSPAIKVPVAAVSENPNSSKPSSTSGKTMRVDQRKLDEYMNLAGELVIARNSLVHAQRLFQSDPSNVRVFKDAVEKVCRIVGDVQSNAMGMRMIPVGTVFQRFPRLVRDVAKTLGKHIELELHGEETELDKQVAEALSDPLVHLVRNAADHGIESPEKRIAAGKRDGGVISLRAGREGNAILIEIEDNGGGIDTERLKEKAVSTGVITQEQAATLSREKTLELIFAPGLSTAQVVSDLSGRGVGMDVVRNNITALGGTVTIRSEVGKGTTIKLALPLTLAVTTVVLVEAGGMTFGLPIDVVQETLKVNAHSFQHLRGVRAVALRGNVIPVKSLGQLVGLSPKFTGSRQGFSDSNEQVPVVVLSVAGARFGVSVDALKGQQEIVLKPVPPQLGQIDGVGGATIMGDGGVVLILDPTGLYRRAARVGEDGESEMKTGLTHAQAC